MLDMFDALEMPVSVLANSAMYEYAPDLMGAYSARGDEIVGHGRTNSERQSVLGEAEERALIDEATKVIAEEGEFAVVDSDPFPHAVAEHEPAVEDRNGGLGSRNLLAVDPDEDRIVASVVVVVVGAVSHRRTLDGSAKPPIRSVRRFHDRAGRRHRAFHRPVSSMERCPGRFSGKMNAVGAA